MTTSITSGVQESRQGFIPGVFDVERLMVAAAAQPAQRDALLALIGTVCGTAPRDLERAWSAWREGQRQQSATLIHSLRGSIGTLGAGIFSATSRELEAAVKEGLAAGHLFQRAQAELQATVDAALAWQARQPRLPPAGMDSADSVERGGALARWRALLAEHNIDAVAQYRQVRPALAALGQARVADIDDAMARLDFAAALQLLGELP
jgi:two-component system, sensor histidine kinase and response regulator